MFLRPTITSEKVRVGQYTYYDASEDTGSFEDERVLYGYGPELLLIGKFCAIAAGVRFVMAAANHLSSGPMAPSSRPPPWSTATSPPTPSSAATPPR
ncbi:MAG: hypothetical protein ACRDST_01230 [Pseudonocardiaceae bacterium]